MLTRFPARVLLLLPALLLGSARAQSMGGSGGAVGGTVTCQDGGMPARNAEVRLVPLAQLVGEATGEPGGAEPGPNGTSNGATNAARSGQAPGGAHSVQTTTDLAGTFELNDVAPGLYVVQATLPGYSDDLRLAQTQAAAFTVDERRKLYGTFPQVLVRPGASARVDAMLVRAAAISGHVLWDTGGTAHNIQVTATLEGGSLVHADSAAGEQASPHYAQSSPVDDRGAFRIAGLPPGTYVLSTTLTEGFLYTRISGQHVELTPARAGTASVVVYAPDTVRRAEARAVRVAEGEEVADADILVPATKLHTLGGTVMRAGAPAANISIALHDDAHGQDLHYDAVSMPDGSFRFELLPAGSYTLEARAMAEGGTGPSPVLARVRVQMLDKDQPELQIDLSAGAAAGGGTGAGKAQ